MQSIETRFYGPTNTKGDRIKAFTPSRQSLWTSYDYGLNSDENHLRAAKLLKEKLEWHGQMAGGHTKTGMVFVFVGEHSI